MLLRTSNSIFLAMQQTLLSGYETFGAVCLLRIVLFLSRLSVVFYLNSNIRLTKETGNEIVVNLIQFSVWKVNMYRHFIDVKKERDKAA